MLAHAGGAATLDAPTWLLAYGTAALVLLTTAAARGRMVVASAREVGSGEPATDPAGTDDDAPDGLTAGSDALGAGGVARGTAAARGTGESPGDRETSGSRGMASPAWTACGRAGGLGALVVVLAVAWLGPATSGANLAPSAVLAVWWVGLPLACIALGDVMAWLDPFGTLARLVPARAAGRGGAPRAGPGGSWTAAAFLGAFTWWALAHHDARSPRALGWFVVAYTAAAVAGATLWGRSWLRRGEGFGALSAALGSLRRATVGDQGAAGAGTAAGGLVPLVAVWLGGVGFDLFTGTRAWVELAGAASGWERTARASACLVAAVVVAWGAVAATVRAAGGRHPSPADHRPVRRAVEVAWLATTAGAFLAHGVTLLLVEGQFALALTSDPFARGWDVFGTAHRAVDYSPLSQGLIGSMQLALVAGGAAWGVVAAAATLVGPAGRGLDVRARLRAVWTVGVTSAVAAAAVVAVITSDLE